MIERYTLPEMGKIWTDSAKFQSWLKVEIAACEANFSLGKVPENAMKEIRSNAKFDESRITEIEKEVKHDVIAFSGIFPREKFASHAAISTLSQLWNFALSVQIFPISGNV